MKLSVINPYNQDIFVELPYDTDTQLDEKIRLARDTFSTWQHTSIGDRVSIVRDGLGYFNENKDKIAEEISGQMGKPLNQSHNEFNGFFERAEHMLEIAEKTLSPEILPEVDELHRRIEHRPLGVVLDIAAWNYPLLIAVNVVIPALLAGNTVLLKHSARTPLCGLHFEKAFMGLQPGLVQNLIMTHEMTLSLIQNGQVDHVVFTGSVPGGRQIYQAVSSRLIGVGLELGGKDPAYVAEDADLGFAAENVVDGACYNAGQSCCAVERVYVHRAVYDEFVERTQQVLEQYQLGDPLDQRTTMGPLASRAALDLLDRQMADGRRRGAEIRLGGRRLEGAEGNFFLPTLMLKVPNDAEVMQVESFGPILPVRPVNNDREALALMNDSTLGLTASVWSSDRERADWFAERLKVGTVYQNRCDYLDPALPWTGVKESGLGSSLSAYGFYHLTRRQSINFRTVTPIDTEYP